MKTSRELLRLALSQAMNLELEAEHVKNIFPDSVAVINLAEKAVEHKRLCIQLRNETVEILNEYNALVNRYEFELSNIAINGSESKV